VEVEGGGGGGSLSSSSFEREKIWGSRFTFVDVVSGVLRSIEGQETFKASGRARANHALSDHHTGGYEHKGAERMARDA
jgi:hypothetical protein